jgi:hypothetical protein
MSIEIDAAAVVAGDRALLPAGRPEIVARIERLQRLQDLVQFNNGAVFQLTYRRHARNGVGIGRLRSQQRPFLGSEQELFPQTR